MFEVSPEDRVTESSVLLSVDLMKMPDMIHLLTRRYHVLGTSSHEKELLVLMDILFG